MLIAVLGCCQVSVWAQSEGVPALPNQPFDYVDYAVTNRPAHFATPSSRDNTPADNQLTNAGAQLGRVLFYDKRLSHGNSMACASCHFQENGFSTPERFSAGVNGALSDRHSMALANGTFYEPGRFLWDESQPTLEAQVLVPIQNPNELGQDLASLNTKLADTSFYGQLFTDAFGSPNVTSDRISKALAQFVRSMVSFDAKYDSIFDEQGQADPSQLSAEELHGMQIFNGTGRCASCHETNAQITDEPHNNGLDATTVDPGAGDATFKVASLRNVEVRGALMHDGRFTTLEQVVDFYSSNIQDHPQLDFRLRRNFDPNEGPVQFNFDESEKSALVAFLKTLTDWNFLNSPLFSDPFDLACDLDGNTHCDVADINELLANGPLHDGVLVDAGNARFDLNGDGWIDLDDVDIWLGDAARSQGLNGPYLRGDANLDGAVDVSDLSLFSANRFRLTTDWSAGDFDGDGSVDVSDYNIWLQNRFQSVQGLVTVPEPTFGPWWGLTLVALLAQWRRIRTTCVKV